MQCDGMKEDTLSDIVKITLEKMRRGGIFDHIGYGFSRYSTDNSPALHCQHPVQNKILPVHLSFHEKYSQRFALLCPEIFFHYISKSFKWK